jgi:hypothetical protein
VKKGSSVATVAAVQPPVLARFTALQPSRACALPLAFTTALASMAAIPPVAQNPRLFWSFLAAAGVLFAWCAILLVRANARHGTLAIDVVLRKPHYIQSCVQASVMLYWGWYWREVYHAAPLLVAQLLFAYAFDLLLVWSRRETYTLGFGPFPVIFSINFFLWFKPDWFYLQFLMVAVGFAAKELIRWNKDGRQAHIFNPSSFPLGVFSLVLIITGTTRLTWGAEIATTLFYPPHIYLFIFAAGLVGQYLFGVTTMTMSAAVTMYVFGLLYFAVTGIYYFFDNYIPIAVFLGMHLLFTDPATAPRTELGRIIFGMLYAAGVILLYAVLGNFGAPAFYDKLLAVPILNMMIRAIDRVARSKALARFDPAAFGRALAPRHRHLAYIGIWTVAFGVMSVAHGVGDTVPGHRLPFWQQACREGRRYACPTLSMLETRYCDAGSGWACNELGIMARNAGPAKLRSALQMFALSCGNGFQVGCDNGRLAQYGRGPLRSADPELADYPIVLREGKGPLPPLAPSALYERACDQGWRAACDELRALQHTTAVR